jgi:hypothetical protein
MTSHNQPVRLTAQKAGGQTTVVLGKNEKGTYEFITEYI